MKTNLVFGRMFIPWIPKGYTPVIEATGAPFGLNKIVAVNALDQIKCMIVQARSKPISGPYHMRGHPYRHLCVPSNSNQNVVASK